jgi:serine/threonine-protein kinase
LVGKSILHYKILEKLGEGGMGIVYKAEDTKLNREVAIKLLPSHLLVSDEDKSRFQREAKAAAALNHPNIATVYEINEYEGTPFIVMEYVGGKTLNDSLEEKPFAINEAIAIVIQIAEGLKAAHQKNIVHRDIKSGNVLYSDDGHAKILDFGLAKTSMSTQLTKMGSTLGTVAYMSPEQVNGKDVDHRTDLWSLGVVIFEMITGRYPFAGDYDQAIFYSILNEAPEPVTGLRTDVPMSLEWIVNKLLAKDPSERYQNANDLIIDLKAVDTSSTEIPSHSTAKHINLKKGLRPVNFKSENNSKSRYISIFTSFIAIIFFVLFLFQGKSNSDLSIKRMNIAVINDIHQQILKTDLQTIAISPNGTQIVYILVENGIGHLYIRSINSFESVRLNGTENARSPFFSPDGRWIGFQADGKLKKIPAVGGSVDIICDTPGFRGASWGINDSIIYSPGFGTGLWSVSSAGGKPRVLSRIDSTRNERTHRWPHVLPDGKWVLYTIGDQATPNSYVEAEIAIQSIKTGEKLILNIRGEMARYVDPGYLLIARNGSILATPFSLKEKKLIETPVTVIEGVEGDLSSGISYFSISQNGHLIFLPGTRNQDLELVWVNKNGNIIPFNLPAKQYNTPRVSPDGKKIAVTIGTINGNNSDIWIYDIQTEVFNRFTFKKCMFDPVWSKDSKKLYYASGASGEGIVEKTIDGRSDGKKLYTVMSPDFPVSITPDGKKLIINRLGGSTEGQILIADLHQATPPKPFLVSDAYNYNGVVSPNGKYIAYGSNESGKPEAFVRTFPDLKGKWQISNDGGFPPVWSPDGKTLYYVNTIGKMIQVPIQYDPVIIIGKARELFDVSQMNFPNNPFSNFDITPDGKKFIMVRNIGYNSNINSFNIVVNWITELQNRFSKSN